MAIVGSIPTARIAGIAQASPATSAIAPPTPAYVAGSRAETSKRSVANRLAVTRAPEATKPPDPSARAVIYMNRRGRFKFAWIDATAEPIRDTKLRDVSELVLRSSKLATSP